jgi:sulfur carrier protein ThiS
MHIRVKLFSSFKKLKPNMSIPTEGDRWEVGEGFTLSKLLEVLGIANEEAAIFLVNGNHATREKVLREGDTVHIFPPMFGG